MIACLIEIISMPCRRPATRNSKLLALAAVTASTVRAAASELPPRPRTDER